jgi:hypothetical protein
MEIEALAGLLAEVVELAEDRAMFPSDWDVIAEAAMGHQSVRRAVRTGIRALQQSLEGPHDPPATSPR